MMGVPEVLPPLVWMASLEAQPLRASAKATLGDFEKAVQLSHPAPLPRNQVVLTTLNILLLSVSVVCSLPIYPQEETRINRCTIIFVVIHIYFYFIDLNPYVPRTYVDAARAVVISPYVARTYVDSQELAVSR